MGQFLKKIAKATLLIVLGLNFALLYPLSPETAFAANNDLIECIIVKNSGCPACDEKYRDFVEPFYDEWSVGVCEVDGGGAAIGEVDGVYLAFFGEAVVVFCVGEFVSGLHFGEGQMLVEELNCIAGLVPHFIA